MALLSGESWSKLTAVCSRRLGIIRVLFVLALLGAALPSFVVSARDVQQYGGVDLRSRIVGARVLMTGVDPYFVDAPPADDRLLDASQIYPGAGKPTFGRRCYPPTLFLMYSPTSWLTYSTQRWFWFAAEWAGMALLAFVCARMAPRPRGRLGFLLLVILGFVASRGWRLHVERGQYYVFLAVLMAGAVYLLHRHAASWMAGIALGIAVALRPTAGVGLLLLFFTRHRIASIAAAATAAVAGLLSLFIAKIPVWVHYIQCVQWLSRFEGTGHVGTYGPPVAEGVELRSILVFPIHNVSLPSLLFHVRQQIPNLAPSLLEAVPAVVGIAVLAATALAVHRMDRLRATRMSLAWVLAGMLLIDWVMAAFRCAYTEVLTVPLLAVVFPVWMRSRAGRAIAAVVFLVLLGSTAAGVLGGPEQLASEWLRFTGAVGATLIYLAYVTINSVRRRRALVTQ
jgi:hypothetical protein